MLMGMLSITAGEARVLGIDVQSDPVEVKQRVGHVPEMHHIYRWMRVREVLGFCKSCFRSWNDETCRELIELFGLDLEKKVKHLSKGMLVKLALLVAVAHEPAVLLLDEPLSGLDPIAREEFLDGVLRTICDRGQTVLISSHMLDDVRRLADTVGILHDGQLLLHGNLDALLTSTKRISATLRDGIRPSKVPEGTIWQRIQGREWTITVRDFSPEKVQQVQAIDGVEHVSVTDLGLEELFKDFIRGQRVSQ
jgi:ABC-2 type transport system ATP-binding protein